MSQLFSPRANHLTRRVLLVLLLASVVLLLLGFGLQRASWVTGVGEAIVQPQPFDHQRHGDLGLDCRYCHTSVAQGAFAGMPATATCMGCHKLVLADSPDLVKVWESFESGKPLRWTRVHDLPQFVHFDHSIHLSSGVGCSSCHGRVDQMAVLRKENTLHMDWCLECHRAPEGFQRPREMVFDMNWLPGGTSSSLHGSTQAGGLALKNRLMDCNQCHR